MLLKPSITRNFSLFLRYYFVLEGRRLELLAPRLASLGNDGSFGGSICLSIFISITHNSYTFVGDCSNRSIMALIAIDLVYLEMTVMMRDLLSR